MVKLEDLNKRIDDDKEQVDQIIEAADKKIAEAEAFKMPFVFPELLEDEDEISKELSLVDEIIADAYYQANEVTGWSILDANYIQNVFPADDVKSHSLDCSLDAENCNNIYENDIKESTFDNQEVLDRSTELDEDFKEKAEEINRRLESFFE